jgi:hypothetical protein
MEAAETRKMKTMRERRRRTDGAIEGRERIRSRKQEPLAQNKVTTDKWLAKNREDMIVCPRQPGQLTISKSSCSKRYIMSRRENLKELLKGDFFQYIYMKGLSVCQDCPIGKKLTLARPASRP